MCCSRVLLLLISSFLFLFCDIHTFLVVDFCFVLQVVPLASVIVKEAMTDEDVLNCQKTIYNLVDMERKNDPLPISTVGTRGKGPKRLHVYLFVDAGLFFRNTLLTLFSYQIFKIWPKAINSKLNSVRIQSKRYEYFTYII